MDESEERLNLFEEPEGFCPPPPPKHTFQTYCLRDGRELKLRLVGSSPLWGNHLWQAAIIVSRFLEEEKDTYLETKTVLELGAGAGLPSILAGIHGAKIAVVTDYPDNNLVENLDHNIQQSIGITTECENPNVVARGYQWGYDAQSILQLLPQPEREIRRGFDTLILADLLFNHSCHEALVKSIAETLARTADAAALVFFSPYRPWLLEKDMAIFDVVRRSGDFIIESLGEWLMDKVMFEKDQGDETLRRTVFGFKVSWRPDLVQSRGS